ncbi:MAG: SRPBCC domain-containing protein [Bacteroidota bacterium]
MDTPLEIKVALTMLQPPPLVFEAIVDPAKMSGYFIASGTARMEPGSTVNWTFPEMDTSFPVKVHEVKKDESISFAWGDTEGNETTVDITLKVLRNDATQVKIIEKSRPNDEAGLKWLKGNTEGWANFLCCLKAYLEYGINLRKGAFEKDQMPE